MGIMDNSEGGRAAQIGSEQERRTMKECRTEDMFRPDDRTRDGGSRSLCEFNRDQTCKTT